MRISTIVVLSAASVAAYRVPRAGHLLLAQHTEACVHRASSRACWLGMQESGASDEDRKISALEAKIKDLEALEVPVEALKPLKDELAALKIQALKAQIDAVKRNVLADDDEPLRPSEAAQPGTPQSDEEDEARPGEDAPELTAPTVYAVQSDALTAALEEANGVAAKNAADARAVELRAVAQARAYLTVDNAIEPELAIEVDEATERGEAARQRKKAAQGRQLVALTSGDERSANICESDAIVALRDEIRAVEDEISILTMLSDALAMPINQLRSQLESASLRADDAKRRNDAEASRLTSEVRSLRARLSEAETTRGEHDIRIAERSAARERLGSGLDADETGRQRARDEIATLRYEAAEALKSPEQRAREAAQAAAQAAKERDQRTALSAAFAAPSASGGRAALDVASLSASELQAALERALAAEDYFQAAEIQRELKTDSRRAELQRDAEAASSAAEAAAEAEALRKATDSGVAWLLSRSARDGMPATPIQDNFMSGNDDEEDEDDPDAFVDERYV